MLTLCCSFSVFPAFVSIGIIFSLGAFVGWCSASTSTQLMSLSELVFKSLLLFYFYFRVGARTLCKCKNKRIININSAALQWCNNLCAMCAIVFGAKIKNYAARARFCLAVACFLSPCSCSYCYGALCAVCMVHCWAQCATIITVPLSNARQNDCTRLR